MKKILFGAILLILAGQSQAQSAIYGTLDDVYRDFMVSSHTQFTKQIQNDFLGVGGDKRFMDNYWLKGGATNNFDVVISGRYLFNYDFLGQELHAKWKDTTIVVNTNYVKRFFLVQNEVPHYFVKSPVLDPQGKYFYESLAFDESAKDSAKVQLLKLRTIKKLKANKNDYVANFSGDFSDNLDNNIEYFIVNPDNTYTKIKLNKKALIAALPKYKDRAEAYFKQVSSFNEETAAGLIRAINQ